MVKPSELRSDSRSVRALALNRLLLFPRAGNLTPNCLYLRKQMNKKGTGDTLAKPKLMLD